MLGRKLFSGVWGGLWNMGRVGRGEGSVEHGSARGGVAYTICVEGLEKLRRGLLSGGCSDGGVYNGLRGRQVL